MYLGIFGHTALDIILDVPKIPELDSSIGVKAKKIRFGGTGANIARASSEMGVNVSLASFVGEDFPDDYHEALKNSGVRTFDLKKVKNHNTPRCWIINDSDGNQIALIDQGPMDKTEKFNIQRRTVEKCDVLHIGTGDPGYYRKIFDHNELKDKLIVFDPAQELEYMYEPKIFKDFLTKSDYFFCNETELKVALSYLERKSPEDILNWVDLLLVTKGAKGSTLYLEGKKIDISAHKPKKVVEPTGAGDAYRAGFYAARSRGYSLKESCEIGSVRASFSIESTGPQDNLVGWEEVIERYNN